MVNDIHPVLWIRSSTALLEQEAPVNSCRIRPQRIPPTWQHQIIYISIRVIEQFVEKSVGFIQVIAIGSSKFEPFLHDRLGQYGLALFLETPIAIITVGNLHVILHAMKELMAENAPLSIIQLWIIPIV